MACLLAAEAGSGGLLGILLLALAWATREVGGQILKRAEARIGKVGYVQNECGFFGEAELEDGRKTVTMYNPDHFFLDEKVLPLRISGDLYNDTDTQLLFTKAKVQFVGPEGVRLIDTTPTVSVDGVESPTIGVPSHGFCRLLITVTILRDSLEEYAQTIPVLELTLPNGGTRYFRLSGSSFYGQPFTVWPRKGDRPIVPFRTERRTGESASSGEGEDHRHTAAS